MSRSLAWTWVREVVFQATTLVPDSACYGFGSFFRGDQAYGDVDLLIVCRDGDDAMRLRERLAPLCGEAPLDLMIMEAAEALSTDFVAAWGCERL